MSPPIEFDYERVHRQLDNLFYMNTGVRLERQKTLEASLFGFYEAEYVCTKGATANIIQDSFVQRYIGPMIKEWYRRNKPGIKKIYGANTPKPRIFSLEQSAVNVVNSITLPDLPRGDSVVGTRTNEWGGYNDRVDGNTTSYT